MAIKYIDEVDLKSKRVVARFDFNVPINSDGEISDTTRIDAALPSIRYLLDAPVASLVMMGHLGRPKGVASKAFSLEPVARYLAEHLGEEVILSEGVVDGGLKELLQLDRNRIILLENIRFFAEEKQNNREFAGKLAAYGDCYVFDAFGTAHRKHASTYEIMAFFKKETSAGFLVRDELKALERVLISPQKPFTAILGGAKIADKIKTIESLLSKVDQMLIGGAMCYPFLRAQGKEVGKSLCSDDDVSLAKKILNLKNAAKIILPVDHVVADSPDAPAETTDDAQIPQLKMGLDIGAKTLTSFSAILNSSKTVIWNGPMGLFEKEDFASGTFAIAKTLSELDAFTLVGGGDSVSAIKKSGISDKISHVSTGGGATLEYVENCTLPAIEALKHGVE